MDALSGRPDNDREVLDREPDHAPKPTWAGSQGARHLRHVQDVRHPVVVPAGLSTGWERTFGDTLLSFVFL